MKTNNPYNYHTTSLLHSLSLSSRSLQRAVKTISSFIAAQQLETKMENLSKAVIYQITAGVISSGIISTILGALKSPEVQKLLALICGFMLVKIVPKHQIHGKAPISFSSWLACATVVFACGLYPELAQAPAMLLMLIAGVILGSADLILDVVPNENDNHSKSNEELQIQALENRNEELTTRLNEANNEILFEQEEKRGLQHLITNLQVKLLHSQDNYEEEDATTTTTNTTASELEAKDQEISDLKSYYESLLELDEKHISSLIQISQVDESYLQTQLESQRNEIQEYRDREEDRRSQLQDSSNLIDAKEETIQKLLTATKGLKEERNAWKREAEMLDREIAEIYWVTEGEDGVVDLYYRCQEAKVALKVADSEIDRLRSQRNEARESLGQLEIRFQDVKVGFETEFLAQSKKLGEKIEEVKKWEERWDEQAESNGEVISTIMEKAAEIEGLEEKVVRLREEVEDQQRARSELEVTVQGWEEAGSSEAEVVVKVEEERWSDDELFGICLGWNW
ncbi:hypothetical protein AC579_8155 [Pseudocercospora musae]|uniref:Uncharacterized protein n=1 Tax=Pseudocercospora musae TaxID=113226 RepID=A0A139IUH0_9PEZI|nr:hypothetical protein AC579_8155 [Pseudocercospora musae]